MLEGQTYNVSASVDHRDNFIIFQAFTGGIMCCMLPSLTNYGTIWDTKGLIAALVLHMLVSEPLYYWIHRLLHSNTHLFNAYHSGHHASPVPQPFTGWFLIGPCPFKYGKVMAMNSNKHLFFVLVILQLEMQHFWRIFYCSQSWEFHCWELLWLDVDL